MLYYNFTDDENESCGLQVADEQALMDSLWIGGYGGCFVYESEPFYCDCGVAAQYMAE